MEESLALRLAAEIESELAAMAQLVAESANAPQTDSIYARRARGSILHDFYNGAERIFERVATELSGGVPNAANWDQQLLADMKLAIPGLRPAVIDNELHSRLVWYRLFRILPFAVSVHDEMYLRQLEEQLPTTMEDMQAQISDFVAWLRPAPRGHA